MSIVKKHNAKTMPLFPPDTGQKPMVVGFICGICGQPLCARAECIQKTVQDNIKAGRKNEPERINKIWNQ
jgi:hypothetical protein